MNDLATQLVAWAEDLPDWQRDLLRRIANEEAVSESELTAYADEIVAIEVEKVDLWIDPPEMAERRNYLPIRPQDLSKQDASQPPVSLIQIKHCVGVNDLAESAELKLQGGGLNIVAGVNGSGKSGYTRVLKQVAASRVPGTVYPNVFNPTENQSVEFKYRQGTGEAKLYTWKNESAEDNEQLRRIRVFDAISADGHLKNRSPVAYVPPVMQILATFAEKMAEINQIIQLKTRLNEGKADAFPELSNAKGAELVRQLGTASGKKLYEEIEPLTKDEIEQYGSLSVQIAQLETNEPAKLAAQSTERVNRLSWLRDEFSNIAATITGQYALLAQELAEEVERADSRVKAASEAMKSSTHEVIDSESKTWRDMWLSAQRYYEECTHHGQGGIEQASLCPLCQQPLDASARRRFEKYGEFLRGEAQRSLSRAIKNRDEYLEAIERKAVPGEEHFLELLASYDVSLADRALVLSNQYLWAISALVMVANNTKFCGQRLDVDDQNGWDRLADGWVRFQAKIEEIISSEKKRFEDLDRSSSTAGVTRDLRDERNSFELRKILNREKARIGTEHDRRLLQLCLVNARKACSSTKASNLNKRLSSEYVIEVCDKFAEEIRGLGLRRVPVSLSFDGTSKAVNYIRVKLDDVSKYDVTDILSEGEQRISAIAGFFADLTHSQDHSVLVFDDPVSSLDQRYRRAVAKRLVEESALRQVIVFSHDITFVQELYDYHRAACLERRAVGSTDLPDIHYVHIHRNAMGAGVPTQSEVWYEVSIRRKIGAINDRIQAATACANRGDEHDYQVMAADIVGSIRELWETLVERELLGGVVTRFRRGVETQRLKEIVPIEDRDIAAVDRGMSVESRFLRGHAAPTDDVIYSLDPEQLVEEMQFFNKYRNELLRRKRVSR